MRYILIFALSSLWATGAWAVPREAQFASIDGDLLNMLDRAGRPVLVVNTASQCGSNYQYEGL